MKVHYDEAGNVVGYTNQDGKWINKETYDHYTEATTLVEEEEETEEDEKE